MRLYPLTFQPIFKDRVWGGRNLERLYRKPLPQSVPIGEAWEITDRPEGVSKIACGPLAGRDLRWLMDQHGAELLGRPDATGGRFPLLLKILDAEQKLSLQVHPPAAVASRLGGEPKTELWYVAHTTEEAALYVGLRDGVTRGEFERRIRDGSVAECFHRLPVQPGDAMFLPSGRVHALGAGNVIFEIQQNSDTTYRVYDWNRLGLDGRPRELHIDQSLACIDFNDFEPALVDAPWLGELPLLRRELTRNPLFSVEALRSESPGRLPVAEGVCRILAVIRGALSVAGADHVAHLEAGGFCLVPACVKGVEFHWPAAVEFLDIRAGCEPGTHRPR
jgi:mannose-6-phosphate isomerase